MTVQITIEFSELQGLIADRDRMRDRIAQLESQPLAFSLERMANEVAQSREAISLTPDQKKGIAELIRRYAPE